MTGKKFLKFQDKFDIKLDYVITEKIFIPTNENFFIGDIVGKSAYKG